jgi:hypothetical protein
MWACLLLNTKGSEALLLNSSDDNISETTCTLLLLHAISYIWHQETKIVSFQNNANYKKYLITWKD